MHDSIKETTKAQISSIAEMCTWHEVYYMYKKPLRINLNPDAVSDNEISRLCRHEWKKVTKCFPAQLTNVLCTDWGNRQNRRETLTHDGRPYTPALVEKCPDCRRAAMLDATNEKE